MMKEETFFLDFNFNSPVNGYLIRFFGKNILHFRYMFGFSENNLRIGLICFKDCYTNILQIVRAIS